MVGRITWTPGIGDPTWIGWTITIVYFVAALLCLRRRHERVWLGLGLAMLFLGFNKQLDLQELLKDVAKQAAFREGWYAERHYVQTAFGVAFLGLSATSLVQIIRFAIRRPRPVQLSLFGAAVVLSFVALRVASFEQLGINLSDTLNAALELGGICVVALGAIWRGKMGYASL